MTSTSADDEIDRLYQRPLAEFTQARNALAKRLGPAGAAIRSLEKPGLAAWGVNQLYWKRRPAFNRLIAAADARRAAHAKLLKGKGGDIAAAEKAHSGALHAAAKEVRALLSGAGHEPSTATMNAVSDTLQAMPGSGRLGRLTEPLRLVGFEALAGLMPASARALRKLAPPPAAPSKEHEEALRRREQAQTLKELRRARQDARQAAAGLAGARREFERARVERERLQDQLQFAVKQVDDAAGAVRESEQRLAQAERDLARLEARLAATR
ncbi:MAG: hypothetical protein ACHQO8_05410 [Vicinamibacterales bacterium]